MNTKTGVANLWNRINTIDWKLLIFLLFFLDVKLWIKVAAIVLIFILRTDFKFGFRLKNSRLPLFYILVMGIAVFNWLISGMISQLNYDLVLLSGLFSWCLCILAIHQIKLAVEMNDPETIHRTILVFFMLNAMVSLAVYAGIILETGHINPYRYQGNFQKYFIGTGDYIKGITLDTSTTNAVLNAFAVVYFLLRGKNILMLLCMTVLLLTGSNITNLLLCCTLIFIFIFQSNKDQKSMIIVCLIMLVTFLVKISPQNNKYIKTLFTRLSKDIPKEKPVYLKTTSITEIPDSNLNDDEKKQKIAQLYLDSIKRIKVVIKRSVDTAVHEPVIKFVEKPVIPKDSIHTPTFQHKKDTTVIEKTMLKFIGEQRTEVPIAATKKQNLHVPGKILALEQTIQYFIQHPLRLLTGTGIGNFSSKLAFRTTAMKISGGYPEKYSYINEDFKTNHLDLYLFYFTSPDDLHSIANSPNSVYDQLLGEYGLAGLFSFAFFYIVFFVKRIKRGGYAIPLLLFMLGAFFVEYWFEQLSIVIFFELLLLLNIKETNLKQTNEHS